MFDSKVRNFFTEIVTSNMKYRDENNVKINDVINLLMQARRDGAIEIENEKAYESAGFATVLESDEIKQSSAKIASRWRNFYVAILRFMSSYLLQNGMIRTSSRNA